MTLTNVVESKASSCIQKKGVSASNAVNAYSKGGKFGLISGSVLVLVSGTLKHFTFCLTIAAARITTQVLVHRPLNVDASDAAAANVIPLGDEMMP